jgi:tRNA1Val (adenine37-N6)-methyltransferase
MRTTDGSLLGGRVSYRQPEVGFRSGIEPVLLAASIPARAGEQVLEAGSGAGAGLLCLTARQPAIRATGVESDDAMAELAAANAEANGFCNIRIVADRIEHITLPRMFDHAMANPPYHRADGSASTLAVRETAKRGSETLIRTWVLWLSAGLRRRGTLTLIVPAGMVGVSLAAMSECRCPCAAIFPLWPKTGRAAKLVLLRGINQGRAPLRLMAGMVLHRADGSFSEQAQSILREGAALALDR